MHLLISVSVHSFVAVDAPHNMTQYDPATADADIAVMFPMSNWDDEVTVTRDQVSCVALHILHV
jgi:hypothetical protein